MTVLHTSLTNEQSILSSLSVIHSPPRRTSIYLCRGCGRGGGWVCGCACVCACVRACVLRPWERERRWERERFELLSDEERPRRGCLAGSVFGCGPVAAGPNPMKIEDETRRV